MSDIFIIPADPVDPATFMDTDVADYADRRYRVIRAYRSEPDGCGGYFYDLHLEEYESGRVSVFPNLSVENIETLQARAVEIAPAPTARDHARFACNHLLQFGPAGFYSALGRFSFQLVEQVR